MRHVPNIVHSYTKAYSLCIWNLYLTAHPVFYLPTLIRNEYSLKGQGKLDWISPISRVHPSVPKLLSYYLCWLLIAAIADCQKCRGLTATWIYYLKNTTWDLLGYNRGINRAVFLLETLGNTHFLTFSTFSRSPTFLGLWLPFSAF